MPSAFDPGATATWGGPRELAPPGGAREGVGRRDGQTSALGPDSLQRGSCLHSAEPPLLDAPAL
eukprot:253800-Pyramimonas_sp.AAC.1